MKPGDVEQLAAAALSDAPAKPVAPIVPTSIDFRCPQCDEEIKFAVEMAGKQAPCPSCRRIIKVPLLTKTEPKDWRKITDHNLALKQNAEPAPDGAWGSMSSTATVSRETLVEAGAVPVEKEPYSLRTKIIAAAVMLLIVGGGFWGYNAWFGNRQNDALIQALKYVDPNSGKPQLDHLGAGEVLRGVGEFYVRDGDLPRAREFLQAARGRLAAVPFSYDRDAALIDLAMLEASMVPDPASIGKAAIRREAEREQERAFRELERTLQLLGAPETRAEAIRAVSHKLIDRKLVEQAPRVAAQVSGEDRVDASARAGLEMLRAGHTREAEALAEQLLKSRAAQANPNPGAVPAPPALVALCVALKKPAETIENLRPKFGSDFSWKLGRAEGLALEQKLDEARTLVAEVLPAPFPLAAVGLQKSPPDATDAETVAKWAEESLKPRQPVEDAATRTQCWLVLGLARLAARADKADLARRLADAIPEPNIRARAKLEVLRARLERSTEKVGDDALNDMEPKTPAFAVAKEVLARHNAARGQSSALLKAIGGWDPEDLRPFGYVGVALGTQGK